MTDKNDKIEYEQVGEIVRIFQRGNKWYVNYQFNGKQRRNSLKTTSKKEAHLRALAIERELVSGTFRTAQKPPTIEAVVAQYKTYLETEGRAARTLTKYTKIFDRIIDLAQRLHRRNILGIDLAFVDAYRQERAERDRAPKTIFTETIVIRQVMNFALRRKLISSDPLEGLKIREPKPTSQPCWTPDQVEQILATSLEMQKIAFTILADTGLRVGELQWLTWADVDSDRNVLHVRPKEGWTPKTGDQRAVPMSPRLRGLLASMARRSQWVVTRRQAAEIVNRRQDCHAVLTGNPWRETVPFRITKLNPTGNAI